MRPTLPDDDPIDRLRLPLDPWALRETVPPGRDPGRDAHPDLEPGASETVFAVANGYLGIRGTPEEGAGAVVHGTFVNGFHETFPIRHAEEAYGFARIGQTMIPVPDATVLRLYVDDEPLDVATADLESYERRLDFRRGVLERTLVWRTASGVRVRVASRRLVSFRRRHLALMSLEVEPLDGDVPITVVSALVNRIDVPEPEAGVAGDESGTLHGADAPIADPRKTERVDAHVLRPQVVRSDDGRSTLGYRTASSGMSIAVSVDHRFDSDDEVQVAVHGDADVVLHEGKVVARAGHVLRVRKLVSYHTDEVASAGELAERARRTLDDACEAGEARIVEEQHDWLERFWARSDVEIDGAPDIQQAVRFNLFHVLQTAARAHGHGVPAKGLTGTGYSGHYFWDTEIYVLPFFTYTNPEISRAALRFRAALLPAARRRARELNVGGALFPWRTINGHEASANYAQGTAQYHIDADIAYAVTQYARAAGDEAFLGAEGAEVLVETARMWTDLGFFRTDGDETFRLHGVTGPDEYTTVVNDNLFTNVMARGNLRDAAEVVRRLERDDPDASARLAERVHLRPGEVEAWERAAEAMYIPYDEYLRVHPQDDGFLGKEIWDIAGTPQGDFPLLLHFHPLVIYRFQVIKQTDVVLAEVLHASEFTAEERARDFAYYEPLTTGDSSLSAVAQAVLAADIGDDDRAMEHFRNVLYIDLADLHRNTVDGIHVASAGGVWTALVFGFGGMRDDGGVPDLDPRLPAAWERLVFRLTIRDARVRAEVHRDRIALALETGAEAILRVRGSEVHVTPSTTVEISLAPTPRRSLSDDLADHEELRRADGSRIDSRIPGHALRPETVEEEDAEHAAPGHEDLGDYPGLAR